MNAVHCEIEIEKKNTQIEATTATGALLIIIIVVRAAHVDLDAMQNKTMTTSFSGNFHKTQTTKSITIVACGHHAIENERRNEGCRVGFISR